MSIQDKNYSLGRAARTTTTLGMAGLVLLGKQFLAASHGDKVCCVGLNHALG